MATTTYKRAREQRDRAVWIALGLALAPVIALGFSRFAYALLLPPMRDALGWSFTQAGGMNTANAIGYVIGAATGAWWTKHFSIRGTFLGSLIISSLALLITGTTTSYAVLMALRFVGGVATAVAFVVGSSLAARIRHHLLPVYFAGAGIGIVLSGIVVPVALAASGAVGWRIGWLVLGLAALAALVPAWLAARAVPEHEQGHAAGLSGAAFHKLAATFAAYILFGAGYVSYMTFVIALLRAQHLEAWVMVAFWLVLGMASAVASLFWGPGLGRLRGGHGMALVSAIAFVGSLPVLLHAGPATALLSAIVFGGSFMAGPTAVTALTRHTLVPRYWTAGIAALTTAFALGQAAGPVVSGLLADRALSPILLALAAGVALLQPHHPHHSE